MLSAALCFGRSDPCCQQNAPHTGAREHEALAFGQQIA
jgi:hypothetical protein